jgi:hypothetical protein
MTIPSQPCPIALSVAKVGGYTVIARAWNPGDSGEISKDGKLGRCRLCPNCVARDNLCLIAVNEDVPDEQLALYRIS